MLALAAMLAMSLPAAAVPVHGGDPVHGAVPVRGAAAAVSGDLLGNPRGTTGDASAQGWEAATIPGWQVSAGLPTVVRYGTPGFPRTAGKWPASRGRVFAGGSGGTARLVQSLPLRLASGQPVPAGTRYQLAAWPGGTKTSWAQVTVRFLSARGKVLAQRTIGPPRRRPRSRATSMCSCSTSRTRITARSSVTPGRRRS